MFKYQEKIEKKNWKIVSNFYKKHIRKGHAITDKKFLFWQFGEGKKLNFSCLFNKKKLISALGYVKLPFFINGKKIYSIWLLYWSSEKDYRGAGFYLLKKILAKHKYIFTINVTKFGKNFYNLLKFKSIEKNYRNIIVFDKKRASKLLLNFFYLNKLDGYTFDKKFFKNNIKLNYLNIKKYKPDWSKYKNLNYSVIRNSKFLTWRYLKHPYFDYKIVYLGEYNQPAVCVYREEKYFGSSKGSAVRIVDLFYPNNKSGYQNIKKLLIDLLNHFRLNKIVFVDFYCSKIEIVKVLDIFKKNKNKFKTSILANRLTPVKIEEFYQNLYYQLPTNVAPNRKNIYFTKSDVDGDVPCI